MICFCDVRLKIQRENGEGNAATKFTQNSMLPKENKWLIPGLSGSTFRVILLWLTLGELAAGPITMPQYPNPDEPGLKIEYLTVT